MTDTHKAVEAIRPIKKEAEKELLQKPGVTGVDIGHKVVGGKATEDLSIRVYVAKKKDVAAKDRIPKTIKGVKTDVIQLTFKPTALVRQTEIEPREDTTRYATLQGGMSIGPCRAIPMAPPDVPVAGNYLVVGTLGALVRDNGTGNDMLLTNYHVAAVDDAWSAGDNMAQPSRVDGGSCPADRIGTLERAVVAGTTAGGGAGVDAAVINVDGRPTECSVIGIGDIEGTAVAETGMAVRKRGRTTELTYGSIGSTDLTVTVPYGDGIGDVMLEDQILIDVDEAQSAAFGISGDSGSVVVNDDNRVVGLYFAGNNEERDAAGNVIVPEGAIGIANPIAAVEAALNVRICSGFKQIEKKLEIKEQLEKSFFKDFYKDLKEKDIKEFKEFGPKELKEVKKELKEPKEIYEDKRFEDKYFEKQEEKHFEGGDFPGFPGRPGFPGHGMGLDERLSRIEAVLGLGPSVTPKSGGGFCEDFSSLPLQTFPNPWIYQGATITVLDYQGNLKPAAEIMSMGSQIGLNAGYKTKVALPGACDSVEVVLAHFSTPATVEAYNAGGSLVASATMTGPSGSVEALILNGSGMATLVIIAPQNEVLILRICCQGAKPVKEKPEKPELKEFKEKIEKFEVKEFKEKPEKFEKPEIKDFKEPKELKEGKKELKEPKELKEARKEIKEGKEIHEDKPLEKREEKHSEKGFEGGGVGHWPGADASMMQRLERIEAALATSAPASHFISPQLRPDLAMGALNKEPDAQAIGCEARKLQKQAADGKATKDSKDSGDKPPEGYY